MPLDLSKPTQLGHLSDDALFAEELAIRYADSHTKRRSATDEGYGQARERCMAELFDVIGRNHGVTQEQTREALLYRRPSQVLAVVLSFALLYGLAATGIVRLVARRYPLEEGWSEVLVAVLFTSTVVSFTGVLLGEVWAFVAETYRVGNDHLSYRADRIPWAHHRLILFVGGVVIFWLIAGLQYRAGIRARLSAPLTSAS
jgi:hypothetical protein